MASRSEHVSPFDLLDLRHITRDSSRAVCRVRIQASDYHDYEWIVCGVANLQMEKHFCRLTARTNAGITDFEHDSAYALSLPLVGVEFEFTMNHHSQFRAWVRPDDLSDFNVPPPGYDPTKDEKAEKCKRCKPRHWIVPAFVPPPNGKLFDKVRGRKVQISFGPVFSEE
jgi:hypothetical protein